MSVGLIPPPNPSYTPGLSLLGVYSAAAGASINCAVRNQGGLTGPLFQSDFDEYELELINIIPSTNGIDMLLRFSTDGGVSYDTAANYGASIWAFVASGGSAAAGAVTGLTAIPLRGINECGNSIAQGGVVGTIKIINPISPVVYTRTVGALSYYSNAATLPGIEQKGIYNSLTPVNACQILFGGGTATGTILVYGKAKSAIAGSVIQTGRVIQQVPFTTNSVGTGTTVIPFDNTVPQNSEGDQYMSLTYTPQSVSNRLKIDVSLFATHSAVTAWITAALFQDAIVNALNAIAILSLTSTAGGILTLSHSMIAGTISPITFKVRVGGSAAGTTTFNGQSGVTLFGGVMISSINVAEILV